MFRFLAQKKAIFSLGRLPLSLEAKLQRGDITNIQTVRFQRKRPTLRSVAATTLGIYVCYHLWISAVAASIPEEVLNEELDEEDSKPIFIPFPGTVKQLKQKPYHGSGPEWQEFIKLSKDQALLNQIRLELVEYVKDLVSKDKMIKTRFGSPIKSRRQWLDIDFPFLAPPEFERSGLQIDVENITWTTQPVDSLTVMKNRKGFWPSAMAQSSWSFAKAFVDVDLRRLKGMLGLSSSPPPLSLPRILTNPQTPQAPTAADLPSQPPAVVDPLKAMTGASKVEQSVPSSNISDRLKAQFSEEIIQRWLPIVQGLNMRAAAGSRAFLQTLSQTWHPTPAFPPKGSILIGGMVELEAPGAYIIIDVTTAWIPKTKTFEPRWMTLKVRRIVPKKQRPLAA